MCQGRKKCARGESQTATPLLWSAAVVPNAVVSCSRPERRSHVFFSFPQFFPPGIAVGGIRHASEDSSAAAVAAAPVASDQPTLPPTMTQGHHSVRITPQEDTSGPNGRGTHAGSKRPLHSSSRSRKAGQGMPPHSPLQCTKHTTFTDECVAVVDQACHWDCGQSQGSSPGNNRRPFW